MNRDDLESLTRRRLAELQPPRAPRTLAPRVMAQIRRRQQSPWYGQPWIAWPWVGQMVSIALLLGLFGLAWHLLDLRAGVSNVLGTGRLETSIVAVTDAVVTLAESARVLQRVILGPIAGHLMFVMAFLGMASALLCAALARLLQEREAGR